MKAGLVSSQTPPPTLVPGNIVEWMQTMVAKAFRSIWFPSREEQKPTENAIDCEVKHLAQVELPEEDGRIPDYVPCWDDESGQHMPYAMSMLTEYTCSFDDSMETATHAFEDKEDAAPVELLSTLRSLRETINRQPQFARVVSKKLDFAERSRKGTIKNQANESQIGLSFSEDSLQKTTDWSWQEDDPVATIRSIRGRIGQQPHLRRVVTNKSRYRDDGRHSSPRSVNTAFTMTESGSCAADAVSTLRSVRGLIDKQPQLARAASKKFGPAKKAKSRKFW